MRLNGPHPNPHRNYLPRRVRLPVRPHVHYLTERYQREHLSRPYIAIDGFALPTTAYGNVRGAMGALARRAHIVPGLPQLPLQAVQRLP
jgi:hypothetical protein